MKLHITGIENICISKTNHQIKMTPSFGLLQKKKKEFLALSSSTTR